METAIILPNINPATSHFPCYDCGDMLSISTFLASIEKDMGARVTSYVDESIVIDINPDNKDKSPEFLRWLRERNVFRDDQIMSLKEGYIKEGSRVCIMGVVQMNDNVLIVHPSEPISTGCQSTSG
uniref:Uncharacterized protein n=1 Tax=Oryza meridionalis TaxID=40149 RepID=A0A0E0EJC4_9ORYZ